jgi:hypothetical protein
MGYADADPPDGSRASTTTLGSEIDGDVLAARWAIPGALVVWGLGSLAMAISSGLRELAIGRSDTDAGHLVPILTAGGLACTALAVLLFLDLAPERIARQRTRLAELATQSYADASESSASRSRFEPERRELRPVARPPGVPARHG